MEVPLWDVAALSGDTIIIESLNPSYNGSTTLGAHDTLCPRQNAGNVLILLIMEVPLWEKRWGF